MYPIGHYDVANGVDMEDLRFAQVIIVHNLADVPGNTPQVFIFITRFKKQSFLWSIRK